MTNINRLMMVLMAVILVVVGAGISAQPAQASGCGYYHVVRPGETLSWIGRYYGVNWVYLAQVNHVAPPRYVIYTGQVLCIPFGGYPYPYPPQPPYPPAPVSNVWDYRIVKVDQDATVKIRTSNFPDNVLFEVSIGKLVGGSYQWIKVADLDSDIGGAFAKTFDIPVEFYETNQLAIRLVQAKKNTKVVHTFGNYDALYYGQAYYPPCCGLNYPN